MGSSPDMPNVPDGSAVAANQQKLNTTAATQSQQGSMTNQVTPYGSLTYNQTGTSSDGTPLYTATTKLSPEQQQLVDTLTGTKQTAQNQAGQVLNGANWGNPASTIGDSTKGLVGAAMNQQVAYLQPQFDYDTAKLDTKLKNQGFAPGQPGYDQAMNALKQSQNQTVTGFLSTIEPQMYQQAVSTYQMPLALASGLTQLGAPTSPTFQNTPQLQIQPANLIGATANQQTAQQKNYENQLAQQQGMLSGLSGIGSSVLGGWAQSGGLSALMGAMAL